MGARDSESDDDGCYWVHTPSWGALLPLGSSSLERRDRGDLKRSQPA